MALTRWPALRGQQLSLRRMRQDLSWAFARSPGPRRRACERSYTTPVDVTREPVRWRPVLASALIGDVLGQVRPGRQKWGLPYRSGQVSLGGGSAVGLPAVRASGETWEQRAGPATVAWPGACRSWRSASRLRARQALPDVHTSPEPHHDLRSFPNHDNT